MIDLKQFCGDDPYRTYLNNPFSVGEFTYATNGHIMVRVERLPDAPEPTTKGKWDAPFAALPLVTFSRFAHKPLPKIPEASDEECEVCEGSGAAHECPDCSCDCEACDGTGKQGGKPHISTVVRGSIYDFRYVTMMLSLPGIEIATNTKGEAPLLFKFDGGVGALMPRRAKDKDHVEIEIDHAA